LARRERHFARRSVAEGDAGTRRKVLQCTVETGVEIVRRFSLTLGAGDAWAELRQAAAVAAIGPDVLDDVLRDVLGWVKREIAESLQSGRPALICAGAFRTHLRAIRQRLDSRLVLVSAAPGIDARAISRELQAVQTYIRQLELVNADDAQKLDAATDFLRASIYRVEWADRGIVHPASFGEFESELESTWRRMRAKSAILNGHRAVEQRGLLLYLECCEHSAKLGGLETPAEFCRGSLHALANHLRIGWHPDYAGLLRGRRSRGDATRKAT